MASAPSSPLTPPGSGTQPRSTRAARRGRAVRWAVLGVVVALLVVGVSWSLAGQWGAVRHDLGRFPVVSVVVAGALSVAAGTAYLPAWRCAQASLGAHLPLRPSIRVFYVGQLGKYLPGSVWPVLAQMELARSQGLPRAQIAVGALLQLALSVLVFAIFGLLSLPFGASLPGAELAGVILAVVIGLAAVSPPVLSRGLRIGLRLLRRPPLRQEVRGQAVLASAGWSCLAALAVAAQGAVLAHGLGAGASTSVLVGGALLLATAVGILVLPVPAGAGVREGALVLLLHARLGLAEATAIALLSRLLLTGADGLLAAVGGLIGFGPASDRDLPPAKPM